MKKIILFLTLVLFSSATAQEYTPWKWLHEKPQGNNLRWVKVWDANTWYAVGYEGTFMKTTNGGNTWYFHHKAGVPNTDGTSNDLYTAHFFNMNTGIVAGADGVMRTTDGGVTFQPLSVPMSTTGTVYQTFFLNDNIGYVAGTSSIKVQRTTDAGLTWTIMSSLTSTSHYDVYSPNDTIIIVALGSGNIKRSTDGGTTWTQINVGHTSTIYKLTFKDPLNGWATGVGGTASYTTDGGLTWNNVSAAIPTTSTLYDVDYRMVGSTEQVVVTGNPSNMYGSTDMGATWTQVEFLGPIANQPWTSTYYSSDFITDFFVTVGGNGLINSRTGTATPVAHTYFVKPGLLYDVWAQSPTGKIVVAGAPGITGTTFDQIAYTTNGGQSWILSTLNHNSNSTFRTLQMPTENVGYAGGTLGAVYKTTNGGVNWDSLTTPLGTSVTVYGADFINETTGWMGGSSGNLIMTTDGGATWNAQTSGITTTIWSVDMVSATTGWYCASSGNVRKTTDGGTTWVAQTSGLTSTCYSVEAINDQVAYVAGASGKISKTTDGGTTWNLLTLPAEYGTSTVYDMDFRGENYGAVTGTSGKNAVTMDGGATWTMGYANNGSSYGVAIAQTGTDTTSAYIVGSTGSILVNNFFVVPVELASFTADVNGSSVTLSWTTATEKNNSGFAVERKQQNGSFEQIAFVQGRGTSTEVNSYSYRDNSVAAGTYIYRLKQIDFDGTYSYSHEVQVEIGIPDVFSLDQNYPNPFNPATVIKYSLPSGEFVNLSVYNAIGEKVAVLVNKTQDAGNYEVTFRASELPSGLYIYRLEAGSFVSVKKMVLIK